MKKECFVIALSFLSCVAHAVTVTSRFEITNRTIDSATIRSTDPTATSRDTGNGLYLINDKYQDANINILNYGNQQLGLLRNTSTIMITMRGQKLGHTFTVLGKYANSSISASPYIWYFFSKNINNGCLTVDPTGDVGYLGAIVYVITSSSNVTANCSGATADYGFMPGAVVRAVGINRDFYLDIGRLQADATYRRVPPDTYVGSGSFRGEVIKNRVGDGFTPTYINNITIVKNPYFESVTLPAGDNVFDTRTVGATIQGNLVIPYVINGQFTPYNTISLQVSSLNGFKLQNNTAGSSTSIPYSLNTVVGSQRVYPLATTGSGSGTVTINNLESDGYAIQGRFNANFSIDKNTAVTGDYSDTLTAIFQIAL